MASRRDFGITAFLPDCSVPRHLFQTAHRSWEHLQPCAYPRTLVADRGNSPVLTSELHLHQGVVLFRKRCQELPLKASDTVWSLVSSSTRTAPVWMTHVQARDAQALLHLKLGAVGSPDFPHRGYIPDLKDPTPPCSQLNLTSWDIKLRLKAAICQFCIC